MRLATLDELPQQVSEGPQSWGEAFGKLATATDVVTTAVDNLNADTAGLERAYDERIAKIRDITGQTLDNPIRTPSEADMQAITATQMALGEAGGDLVNGNWIRPDYAKSKEEEFNSKVQALADQYPAVNDVIATSIADDRNRQLRDAERQQQLAASAPELGAVGGFMAQIVGGLTGAARDPAQWRMALLGAGASEAPSVAARIGRTMLTEALLNGGQEAVLQAASQQRRRDAGLEYGMESALKNIGVSAVFGSLFGGSLQGASELARIYKMGKGGEEIAARVLDGTPQPGDVETLAKAVNVELSPEKLDMLNRSFEEKVLDDVMIAPDAPPEQHRVLDAAMRYAEDPDNHPPPEVVERMIADEESGPLRTLNADQYERAYGGDANAIDDIRDTFFGDDVSRFEVTSSSTIDPSRSNIVGFQTEKGSTYIVDGKTTKRNKAQRDLPGHEGDFGSKPQTELTIYVDENAGALSAVGLNGLDERGARVALRDGKATLVTWNKAANGWGASEGSRNIPYHLEPAIGRYPLELWKVTNDVPGHESFSRMHAGNRITSVVHGVNDALDVRTIRPEQVAEPATPEAMKIAEGQAGEIAPPRVDANGNPENVFDFLPFEDGNGNRSWISTKEALDLAAEPHILADIMETCNL